MSTLAALYCVCVCGWVLGAHVRKGGVFQAPVPTKGVSEAVSWGCSQRWAEVGS